MKGRRRYSVVKKPVSKGSRVSVILALVSAAAILFCVIVSSVCRGNGASFIGAVGLGAAFLAAYGCVVGIKELAENKNSYKRSYTGAILSGVVFIIWLAIFLTGIKG